MLSKFNGYNKLIKALRSSSESWEIKIDPSKSFNMDDEMRAMALQTRLSFDELYMLQPMRVQFSTDLKYQLFLAPHEMTDEHLIIEKEANNIIIETSPLPTEQCRLIIVDRILIERCKTTYCFVKIYYSSCITPERQIATFVVKNCIESCVRGQIENGVTNEHRIILNLTRLLNGTEPFIRKALNDVLRWHLNELKKTSNDCLRIWSSK